MKVVKNDNKNNSLTLAEMEAIQQFEASHRAGQAAPTCMVFCEEVGRFGITILEGRYSVEEARTEDEQWYRHEADGMRTPIDNPLEGAWQAAAEVREELKRKLDLKFNTIAVGWFPDMEPDEDILTSGPSGKGTDCCCVTCLAARPRNTAGCCGYDGMSIQPTEPTGEQDLPSL